MDPTYPPPPPNLPADDNIDLKRYLSLFLSNWYWFAIALFFAVAIAYAVNRWSEEYYTVSATLLIKDDEIGGVGSGMSGIFPGVEAFQSRQNLKNEMGILRSFTLNHRVMQRLSDFHVDYISVGRRRIVENRLYTSSPFVVRYDSLNHQRAGVPVEIEILPDDRYRLTINGDDEISRELMFGEPFREGGFDFSLQKRNPDYKVYNKEGSNRYYFYFNSPASLANNYRGKLSVSPIDDESTLVTLTTSGAVPGQEADYLNMLMDEYIQAGLEYKNQTASQTIDFIETQLSTISDSLHLAEGDLESFRLSNKLIDISREGSVISSNLEKIDAERTSLLLRKNYYEYLRDYVETKKESGDIVAPSVMGVSDQILVRMVEELSQLQQQKKQFSMNLYQTAGPLGVIEDNINSVRASITENISNGLLSINNSLSDADRRLAEIEKEIRKLPSTERQMINIQRKFDLNNTVYTFLLEKRAEAGIARASTVSDNRIIDRANAWSSQMIRPTTRKNYMMAIMLGLLLPAALILLIDFLNNKIIDRKDVERLTTVPIAGYIGHNGTKTELPVISKPGSTLSESFRSLRTNLKFFTREISCPVIAVSSTISSEGKTFISVNLAAILASMGKRVLVIGLDLRRPRIQRVFEADNGAGMSTWLAGEGEFSGVIVSTGINNLMFAPAGPVPPNPAELIETRRMGEFLEQARKEFDYVIIDTPPLAIVTDAMLISAYVDMYLLIVRQGYTSKSTLELIEELYKKGSVKNPAIVINDISAKGYYGHGLRYGNTIGYGYSYGYNYYDSQTYGRYTDSSKAYYKDI